MKWILIIKSVLIPFVVAQESGWGEWGAYHYYFSLSPISGGRSAASTKCHSYGAELASIVSEDEQVYITGRMIRIGYWIGLTNDNPCDYCKDQSSESPPNQACESCRSTWRWLDNASYEYENWERKKPDNNAECARLFKTGQWRNEGCNNNYKYICKTEDLCARNPDPCTRGTCDMVYTRERFRCTCEAGYEGRNCSQDIDECSSMPCQNGGSCENRIAEYRCLCPTTWTGVNCETDVNECLNGNICSGNGNCTNELGSYECECHSGFTGVHCETDINECVNQNQCNNSVTCRNEPRGSFTCECMKGWEGVQCAQDINECENPGMCGHGNCANRDGGYSCSCDEGYSGARCDVSGDEDDDSDTLWVVFYVSLVCMCVTGITCAVMLVIDIKETRFDKKKHNDESTKQEFDELVQADEAIPSTSRDVSRGVYINEQEINSMYRQRVLEGNMSMTE